MAVQLSRIAVGLPVVLERALVKEREEKARVTRTTAGAGSASSHNGGARGSGTGSGNAAHADVDEGQSRKGGPGTKSSGGVEGNIMVEEVEGVFPRHVLLIVRGMDAALEKMEKILKG